MRLYQTNYTREGLERTIKAFNRIYSVSPGSDDSITVYHDKDHIYVYCENHRLDYAGLEVFERESGELCHDIFVDQNENGYLNWLLNTSRVPSKIRFLCQWWM